MKITCHQNILFTESIKTALWQHLGFLHRALCAKICVCKYDRDLVVVLRRMQETTFLICLVCWSFKPVVGARRKKCMEQGAPVSYNSINLKSTALLWQIQIRLSGLSSFQLQQRHVRSLTSLFCFHALSELGYFFLTGSCGLSPISLLLALDLSLHSLLLLPKWGIWTSGLAYFHHSAVSD